jgi:hypothetical protein
MSTEIKLLHCGNCEELKLGVHGTALALAVLCGAYNTAAWLLRRERHLAANSILYSALAIWEIQHVRHHWMAMAKHQAPAGTDTGEHVPTPSPTMKAAA